MSRSRRLLALFGFFLLIGSVVILLAATLPIAHLRQVNPFSPPDMLLRLLIQKSGGGPVGTPAPGSTPSPETREVEIEWPKRVRIGSSDAAQLSLFVPVDDPGLYTTSTPSSPGNRTAVNPIDIEYLYDTHTIYAIAEMDSAGFGINHSTIERQLLPGQAVHFFWTIKAEGEPGQQLSSFDLRLKFVPKDGSDPEEHEIWSKLITIQTVTVFGMPGPLAQGVGVLGSFIGSVVALPFAESLWKGLTGAYKKRSRKNNLKMEEKTNQADEKPRGIPPDGGQPEGVVHQEKAENVRAVRILFLAANPKGTSPLRLDEEIRSIDQALRRAEFRERFEIEQQWAVRVEDLQEHLLRYSPDIVHFSGHGSDANEIILEDLHGSSQPVSAAALSNLFGILKDNIRCVVLNACYSEGQAKAIAEHIDCVVGMSKAIGDEAAISFAGAFYRALGYGRNVETAFRLGISEIDLEGLPEQDTPRLLASKNQAKEVIFIRIE